MVYMLTKLGYIDGKWQAIYGIEYIHGSVMGKGKSMKIPLEMDDKGYHHDTGKSWGYLPSSDG